MVIGLLIATGASLTASVLVVQVAVLPLMFKYSKSVQRKIVFSNCCVLPTFNTCSLWTNYTQRAYGALRVQNNNAFRILLGQPRFCSASAMFAEAHTDDFFAIILNYPRNLDYDNPSSVNIIGGRNFCIQFQSKVDKCPVKIGVWHMIPCSILRQVFVIRDYLTIDTRLHDELKKTRKTIVLYCHGNSNHRASPHRLRMYKIFQELDFHIIAFDYRGYGDSSPVRPTEQGVVEDALSVYSWLLETLKGETRPTILLWGHSLGTAVAANLVAHMTDLCKGSGKPCLPLPDALVLEAPFNNLMDEIECHPFSKIVSWLPYFKDTFVKPFSGSPEFSFTTDQYLTKVPQLPILFLHSKFDRIVPYELSVKLHDTVVSSRAHGGAPVVFHSFEGCQNLGHNNLCEAKDIKEVVTNFLSLVKGV